VVNRRRDVSLPLPIGGKEMKTVKRVEIEKELDDFEVGWWNPDREEFIPFSEMSDEDKKELCSREDFRDIILATLEQIELDIKLLIGKDLESIWKRLDEIEGK